MELDFFTKLTDAKLMELLLLLGILFFIYEWLTLPFKINTTNKKLDTIIDLLKSLKE